MLKDYLHINRIVLMVQKEFGQKMVAKPGSKNYGRLSVTSQIFFDVKKKKIIPRHLFFPIPKVDSIIIELIPKHIMLSVKEESIIRKLFSLKNKKIRNIFENVPARWANIRPRTMSSEQVLKFIQDSSQTNAV